MITRRAFVPATALGIAGCAAGVKATQPAPPPPAPPAPPSPPPAPAPTPSAPGAITAETIAEAEKLLAVDFTPAERAQLLEDIPSTVARARELRGHVAPPELPPAMIFVPGPVPPGKTSIRPSRTPAPAIPSSDEDIAFAPVTALGRWLRAGKLTSVALTKICLHRLKTLGPRLECVVTLTEDLALAQARDADADLRRGRDRGPLHGIPYGAKDLLDTKGIPTTWGVALNKDRVPAADAVVVRRLADAGAVLVAKLSLGELAMGEVWFGGITRNPWNLDEGSSGSSAGSAAAVAAGLVPFAIGSETLGSIVSPAMRCGVTGLRPTFGRVARTGAMALSHTMDKLGPLTRTVEDAVLVLAAIQGRDPGDPSSVDAPLVFDAAAPVRGLRAGYVPAWFAGAGDVERALLPACQRAGLKPVEITFPDLPWSTLRLILHAESAACFDELVLSGKDDQLRQQTVNAYPNGFRGSRFISAVDVLHADRVRRQAMQAFARVFEGVDVIVGPSYGPPMPIATNMTGHPSLTLPAGFVDSAPRGYGVEEIPVPPDAPRRTVPHGITVWGRLFDEGTLARVGMALEQQFGVWSRRPPIS